MKQPIRRLLALLLALAIFSAGAWAGAARGALIPRVRVYSGQFSDVSSGDWFYPYVAASYEYALLDGRGGGFAPNDAVTVAELLTLAARLRAAYDGETIAAGASPWYAPYIAYLSDKGLPEIPAAEYDAPATRAQLAGILAAALPDECFDGPNSLLVTDAYASGAYIADVGEYTPYQPQILWLYRQGLLAGADAAGNYCPSRAATRAEAAAIVTRMADPALRIKLDWTLAPVRQAAGTTLASLVRAPDAVSEAPDFSDSAAIDALVRQMLSQGAHTLSLRYPRALTRSDAAALADAFAACVKSYCEQMYNTVLCRSWSDGTAELLFSSSACTDAQLAQYREAATAKALAVRDMLWETGQLTADMNEYDIARVYYLWLCDNCEYDHDGAQLDNSPSHAAYSALLDGRAACDGYTGAYNLFLKLEGIGCYALCNDAHIWTVAELDGTPYHVDATWGDQSGYTAEQFFGMTAEESYQLHPW